MDTESLLSSGRLHGGSTHCQEEEKPIYLRQNVDQCEDATSPNTLCVTRTFVDGDWLDQLQV